MRDAFVRTLTALADDDPRVVLLTADLGFKLFDEFERRCPGRFFNLGVAEANMISVAAGLALDGRRPFAYSIVPFVTARCLEQIRNDACEMELPVTVVGVGGGYAYGPNGPTHHGVDDIGMMRTLPGMTVIAPCDPRETAGAVRATLDQHGPGVPQAGPLERSGAARHRWRLRDRGADGAATGSPGRAARLRRYRRRGACAPRKRLSTDGLDPAVLSVHTVKPLGALVDRLAQFDIAVRRRGAWAARRAVRSDRWRGGGDASGPRDRSHRICAPDRFHRLVGSSAFLRAASGLDAAAIAGNVSARTWRTAIADEFSLSVVIACYRDAGSVASSIGG